MTAPIAVRAAERAVLGAVMLRNRCWDEVADLDPGDFLGRSERAGFEVFAMLARARTRIDPITLMPELERRGWPATKMDVAEWMTAAPHTAHVRHHVAQVRAAATLRRLRAAADEIADEVQHADDGLTDPEALLARAEAALWAVRRTAPGKGLRPVAELLPAAVDSLEGVGPEPVATGFRDLDALLLGGLRPGEMTVLAARPSMGKTTLALNIISHAAARGVPVAFFSLEMTAAAVLGNMVLARAGVRGDRARARQATDRELAALNAAAEEVHGWPLLIDDQADLDVSLLAARARRARSEGRAGLVVTDYLQALRGEGRTEYEQVSSISASLKTLAKNLAVPVLAVAQLARGTEARSDHKPMMADLRGSGRVEQDADLILLMHRPEYYEPQRLELAGRTFLRIAKQRQGPCGSVELRAELPMFRFADGPLFDAAPSNFAETTRADLR